MAVEHHFCGGAGVVPGDQTSRVGPDFVGEITSYCLWNPSDLWHLPPDLFVVHIFLAEEYPTWLGWVFFPCKTVWSDPNFENPSVFLPTKINRPIVSPGIKLIDGYSWGEPRYSQQLIIEFMLYFLQNRAVIDDHHFLWQYLPKVWIVKIIDSIIVTPKNPMTSKNW